MTFFKARIILFVSFYVIIISLPLTANEGVIATSESFESSSLPPKFKAPASMKKGEKEFRKMMKTMPESKLVGLTVTFAYKIIGLSKEERKEVKDPIISEYAALDKNPAFANLPSAFPYCYNTEKNKKGHYFLTRPDKVQNGTRAIVFLHGFAGNFQVYPKVMSEAFPDSVIICPSWGISWSKGNPQYVKDAIEDAQKKLNIEFGDIWLIGLSAGGKGGFKVYSKLPGIFKGYICIAASPGSSMPSIKNDAKILMINGISDKRFPISNTKKLEKYTDKYPNFKIVKVKGGHYFLITDKKETFKITHDYVNKYSGAEQ